ncbi:SPOR domain-containing protein [Magnetococcus sp. PR-3]|uniref:SPOR domain-containing protein n=1 Tax=Magnetococcus sp. PR-3 TaxID=3120355 RepID=UPI002FCDFCE5
MTSPPPNRVVLNWRTREDANRNRAAHVQVWLHQSQPQGQQWQTFWQKAIDQRLPEQAATVANQVVRYHLTSMLNQDGSLLTMVLRQAGKDKTVWVGNMPATPHNGTQVTTQALGWIERFLTEQEHPVTHFTWQDTPLSQGVEVIQASLNPSTSGMGTPRNLEEKADAEMGKRTHRHKDPDSHKAIPSETKRQPATKPSVITEQTATSQRVEKRRYAIQVESDRSPSLAENSRVALENLGLPAYVTPTKSGDWYLVRVGPFFETPKAQAAYDTLKRHKMWQKKSLYPVINGRTRFEPKADALWH